MRLFPLFVLGVLLLATMPIVLAEPINPSSLQALESSRRELPGGTFANASAQGGNVTRLQIDAISITNAWQGYFGNITGNIRLEDGQNETFYSWGNATPTGEVYASRNSTIDWSTINCTDSSERLIEESHLEKVVGDGDSVTNTYNSTAHPSFFIGTKNITQNSCYSTNVYVNGVAQSTEFYQVLLSDGDGKLVYSTIIEAGTLGYNNEEMDFQLLVGENNKPGNEAPTTYYFFTELG